jgi:uncharacterized membrane protein YqjE
MADRNEAPEKEDLKETVDFISSKINNLQLLTVAAMAGVVGALVLIASLISMVSVEFWKEFIFSMAQAAVVLIAICWIGKRVYALTDMSLRRFLSEHPSKHVEDKTPSETPTVKK